MNFFNTKKEDYKKYVYVRIPIEEYEEIMQGKKKITKGDLEAWRFSYDLKQSEKQAYARRAARIKQKKTILKLLKALENYYTGLFKEEKELNPNKLAKLASVNYKTANKFWKEHNLQQWIPKFEENPQQALKDFKIIELSEILS